MLGRKDISEIKDNVESLRQELEKTKIEHHQKIDLLSDGLKMIGKDIQEIKAARDNYVQSFNGHITEIATLKDIFQKTVRKFEHLQSTMYDNVYGKLDRKLQEYLKDLNDTTEHYNNLKPEVKKVTDILKETREEIDKFHGIAKNLQANDFELKHYAKELAKMDKEKLELMRKIETLQKIIAHERRKKY